MPFDTSCVHIFRAVTKTGTPPLVTYIEDTTALYAMIDAAILAKVLEGLTQTQKDVVNSYLYVPTADDFANRGFPRWAGNDPVAVYFKITGTTTQQSTKLQQALSKYYRQ